jgi:hypothetical protein
VYALVCCGVQALEAPGTLSWLGGLAILIAGVAVPLVVAAYRNRGNAPSAPVWRRH